ncbi:hypothetical protein IFM51744_06909 [Aspergillus udagawae]|uniref:Uncharacterized protein n=1 Tax=Aspergillus udagawae TaxID=91492 RepID=A0ABQ1B2K5_9EURO|nr:hypothetical protein IFM51744_06909 [Aspergillus udagawae]GFF92580.1 hypothetical protein IFM53868_06894 [Aspergillus udagawae]GFG08292.1 hypothetical protein IFM5058_03853 [Aspergillus udagawae]
MEDVRPTAKWANRMLRPLTSIYHRLEKHNEILSSIAQSKWKERSENADTEQAKPRAVPSTEASCQFSDEEPDDPAWVPGKREKRRIRHNYSSRGQRNGGRRRSRLLIRSPELQRTLPGAIEIATPLITGKVRQTCEGSSIRKRLFSAADLPAATCESHEGATGQRKTTRTKSSSFPAYQGSWKEVLDLSGDAGLVDIAHLLDRIFLKFLRNTRAIARGSQQRGPRARSLVSMIARRLPEFIADEQRFQDETDGDCKVDMCDAYFTELEAYYAPNGNGWEPLREAVRAQGIHLVVRMIENGWLTRLVACRLMEECLQHGEADAFEMIISSCLSTINAYPYPPAFDPQRPSTHCDDPVYILRTYYSRCGGRAFVYNELAKLLLRRAVPPEWMVTTWWKKCVDEAIRSVSTEDSDSPAATHLIEATLLSAGGIEQSTEGAALLEKNLNQRQVLRLKETRASVMTSLPANDSTPCPIPVQNALSNLVSSLVTALCGMHIARSNASDAPERLVGIKARHTINCLAMTVEKDIGLRHRQDNGDAPSYQSLRRGYLLLGNCMLQIGEETPSDIRPRCDPVSKQRIDSFFESLALQQDMLKELSDLVQRVSRYCGQGDLREQTRTSRAVRTKISQLARQANFRGLSYFLGRVAAETAMALAEKTLDPDDHVWAVQIQESVVSMQQGQCVNAVFSDESEQRADHTGLYRWEESIGEWIASTPKPKAGHTNWNRSPVVSEAGTFSIISCSDSSESVVSAASERSASSVTSSAPSLPAKRTYSGDELVPRPIKKLRSRTVEIYADGAQNQTGGARSQPSCLTSVRCSSVEARCVPVAARTRSPRSVLGELVQAKNVPNRAVVGELTSVNPSPKLEVVIVNRKNSSSLDEPIDQTTEHVLETCALPARQPRLPIISKPANPKRPSSSRISAAPRLRVIPCSQDDESEDELSFL